MSSCPFLSTEEVEIECFKECPFYCSPDCSGECPFKTLSFKEFSEDTSLSDNFSLLSEQYDFIADRYFLKGENQRKVNEM